MLDMGCPDSKRKKFEMSPTFYVVHFAKLEAELAAARPAGDVPRMQVAIAGLTGLIRSMYGPATGPGRG
jgi:hypothetical protein